MQKIPTLFQRNYDGDHFVRDEVTPGAEWVLAGEGVATYKYDGTCCKVAGGALWKRYDAKAFTVNKPGGEKLPYDRKPPVGFIPAQEPDENTGHWPGWLPVGDRPEDQWHREGLANFAGTPPDGTYELCGPKIGTNREGCGKHMLFRHGSQIMENAPRHFDGLREYLENVSFEGLVYHHPDGRMVKIKRKDFWPSKPTPAQPNP